MKYNSNSTTLCVVISAYTERQLHITLTSIALQATPPSEIILIYNGHENIEKNIISYDISCNITSIITDKDTSISEKLNIAINKCTSDYMLFLGAGCTFSDKYCTTYALSLLQNNPSHVLMSDYVFYAHNSHPQHAADINPLGHLIQENPSANAHKNTEIIALTSLHHKIISTKFLHDNNITFDSDTPYPEYIFHAKLLHYAQFSITDRILFCHPAGEDVANMSPSACQQEIQGLAAMLGYVQEHLPKTIHMAMYEFLWSACLRHAKKILLTSNTPQERHLCLQSWHVLLKDLPQPSAPLGNEAAQTYLTAIQNAAYTDASDMLSKGILDIEIYPFFNTHTSFFQYQERCKLPAQWRKFYKAIPPSPTQAATTGSPVEILTHGRCLLLWGESYLEVLDGKTRRSLSETVGTYHSNSNYINTLLKAHDLHPLQEKPQNSKKLRILTFCTTTHAGAGEGSMRRVKALRELGHEVYLIGICSTRKDNFVARIISPMHRNFFNDMARSWNNIAQTAFLSKKSTFQGHEFFTNTASMVNFNTLQPLIDWADIIHLHWIDGMMDFENFPKVFGKKPVVWTLADMNVFTGGCHYAEGCTKYQQECLPCPMFSGEDARLAHDTWKIKNTCLQQLNIQAVAPSPNMAHLARKSSLLRNIPIHCIPNIYPIDVLQILHRKTARAYAHLPQDVYIILFGAVGKQIPRKGMSLLEEALLAFEKNFPQLAAKTLLLTFGGGNFITQSSIKTCHIGPVPQRYMPLLYATAQVTAVPSTEDTGPMTVGESLLCGVPVVTFSALELPNLLGTHKETSYVAKSFDTQDFAHGLAWALEQPSNLDYRKKIRRQAEKYCSPTVGAKCHEALYKAMLENKNFIMPNNTVELLQCPENIEAHTCAYIDSAPTTLPTDGPMIQHWVMRHEKRKDLPAIFSERTDFNEFTYARQTHFEHFIHGYLINSDTSQVSPDYCDLKAYQDGLCAAFIDQMFGDKAVRILEIGGAHSRVLNHYCVHHSHECWNIDKFEGVGNGPLNTPVNPRFTLVRSYIGEFSKELPENYFDLVFSTSVLEHVPENETTYANICNDIDRVLKPGGYSFHLMDFGLKKGEVPHMHGIIPYLFSHRKTLNDFVLPDNYIYKNEIYGMTRFRYDYTWINALKTTYADFGMPTSINVFWKR